MAEGISKRRDLRGGGRRRLLRIGAGAAFGALLAVVGPNLAFADLQLATVGCSDVSSFDVSVDTDTLNMLTNAVTSLNTENLGLSCSVAVQAPPPLPLGIIALAGNQTSVYATGGGSNDAGIHFAFSAHVDPGTGAAKGHANIQFADSTKVDGDVFCYNNFSPTTRFAQVGIMVNQGGTTSPLVFQTQDAGTPSSTQPSSWQIEPPGYSDNCNNADSPNNTIVKGNVVVRP